MSISLSCMNKQRNVCSSPTTNTSLKLIRELIRSSDFALSIVSLYTRRMEIHFNINVIKKKKYRVKEKFFLSFPLK